MYDDRSGEDFDDASMTQDVSSKASRSHLGVSVHAGFPNAAADRQGQAHGLDFNRLLVRHPSSTYCFRIRGNNHENRGIFDNDIAVIDRACTPLPTDRIICWRGDNFMLSRLSHLLEGDEVWGVVTAIIHEYRR